VNVDQAKHGVAGPHDALEHAPPFVLRPVAEVCAVEREHVEREACDRRPLCGSEPVARRIEVAPPGLV